MAMSEDVNMQSRRGARSMPPVSRTSQTALREVCSVCELAFAKSPITGANGHQEKRLSKSSCRQYGDNRHCGRGLRTGDGHDEPRENLTCCLLLRGECSGSTRYVEHVLRSEGFVPSRIAVGFSDFHQPRPRALFIEHLPVIQLCKPWYIRSIALVCFYLPVTSPTFHAPAVQQICFHRPGVDYKIYFT